MDKKQLLWYPLTFPTSLSAVEQIKQNSEPESHQRNKFRISINQTTQKIKRPDQQLTSVNPEET